MSNLIYCDQVSKKYGNKSALKGVSFECHVGEPIALVGPNGAGKTTLLSLLCHYFQPSSGTIRVLGYEPGDPALYGLMTALPQDAQFDPVFPVVRQLAFYAELLSITRGLLSNCM